MRAIEPEAIPALDALLRVRLARRGRASVGFVAFAGLALAIGMFVVRVADGATAFLPGVVARAIGVYLVLAALPFGLGMARLSSASIEPGVATLAKLRGASDDLLVRRLPIAAVRIAFVRALAFAAPFDLLAVVLTVPDGRLAANRALVVVLLTLLGAFASATLAALGAALARSVPRVSRLAFGVIVILPWMIASFPGVPREASLPGVYEALVDVILRHVAR